jgi:preprotein translocase subunit YajC
MDFIERLFGLSPDNGDGSTEILWLVVLAIVIAALFYFRRQRRKAKQIFRR